MKFSRYIFYWLYLIVKFGAGSHLLSHTVSSAVPSAAYVLTVVFGMGTGVSHKRITTGKYFSFVVTPPHLHSAAVRQRHSDMHLRCMGASSWKINNITTLTIHSLERRWSSRTFRYGYLVTTSPQLSILPSAAPSLRLGHWLRALPTPMVWRAVCTRPGNVFTAACWSAITSDSSFM